MSMRLATAIGVAACLVEAYFDVTVDAGDPDRFDAIHDQIGEILPGPGDLNARVAAYHERDRAPRDHLGEALQTVSRALRDLTRARFGLPDLRSVVTINADVAHGMSSLPRLATHEVYPGHHTKRCLKETGLVRERDQAEQTIMPVNTPQCLVSEGVAELGMHALLGPGWGTWTQHVLDGLGLAREWLDARPPTQSVADRYQLLLREQFLPADLR